MKLVYIPSDGSGNKKYLTNDEALYLIKQQYGEKDALLHLDSLLHGKFETVSTGNGGVFIEAE